MHVESVCGIKLRCLGCAMETLNRVMSVSQDVIEEWTVFFL